VSLRNGLLKSYFSMRMKAIDRFRRHPLEVQAASYLAASVRMVSFSRTSISPQGCPPPVMPPVGTLDGVDDPEEL